MRQRKTNRQGRPQTSFLHLFFFPSAAPSTLLSTPWSLHFKQQRHSLTASFIFWLFRVHSYTKSERDIAYAILIVNIHLQCSYSKETVSEIIQQTCQLELICELLFLKRANKRGDLLSSRHFTETSKHFFFLEINVNCIRF